MILLLPLNGRGNLRNPTWDCKFVWWVRETWAITGLPSGLHNATLLLLLLVFNFRHLPAAFSAALRRIFLGFTAAPQPLGYVVDDHTATAEVGGSTPRLAKIATEFLIRHRI